MTIEEVEAHFSSGKQHQIEKEMSNYDHSIDEGLEDELRSDPMAVAQYAAWNFHGDVFYKDNEFHCIILCYRVFQEIISAPTLQEIMDKCSDKYGYD